MPQRTTVFVSYCHRDSRWLRRLQVHLKPFGARGDLVLWDDTRLGPGDRWRPAIRDAIEHAAASILLISADFLASDFVTSEELPQLLEKAETAGARTRILQLADFKGWPRVRIHSLSAKIPLFIQ